MNIENNEILIEKNARRGGAEVAGWTLDQKIGVRFPVGPLMARR